MIVSVRAVAGAAVATAAVVAALAPPVPAAGHAAAACTGVAVVVDFGSLGGVHSRCAAGDPSSGLGALSAVGFSHSFAPSGLICQISSVPSSCERVPPIDAYWSYWHARPGGSWAYSNTGADRHDPAPGSVEGWAFGAGRPPSIPPPAASAPAPPAPSPPPATQLPAQGGAEGGRGDTLGLIAGIALVGGLGGLALWTARRRSRASGPVPADNTRPPPAGA